MYNLCESVRERKGKLEIMCEKESMKKSVREREN